MWSSTYLVIRPMPCAHIRSAPASPIIPWTPAEEANLKQQQVSTAKQSSPSSWQWALAIVSVWWEWSYRLWLHLSPRLRCQKAVMQSKHMSWWRFFMCMGIVMCQWVHWLMEQCLCYVGERGFGWFWTSQVGLVWIWSRWGMFETGLFQIQAQLARIGLCIFSFVQIWYWPFD